MSNIRVNNITDEAGTGAPNFPNGATGVDPLKYAAASGATQALDVGSSNFFDAGSLTADTTVSFSSVPTEANWKYSFKSALNSTTIWDVTTASYLQNFSVSAQEATPNGVFFKPDGTKMYVIGTTGQDVNEYDLSTAWDVSTASYLQNFSVSAQETTPNGVFFKPDGTKMYVTGNAGDDVNEYDLSTAWDVSTASYLQNFSVAAQETNTQDVFFKPDGTKMYVMGITGDDVNEYDLSTAWDVSTASYLQLFSVATEDTTPTGLFFKPDGTKMYVIGTTGRDVNEYDLSTAWDVSTASYLQLFSVATEDTAPTGLFFKPDGTKMYVIGNSGDNVYEYDVGSTFSLTLPASIENPPTITVRLDDRATYDFFTADGGTTVTLISEEIS